MQLVHVYLNFPGNAAEAFALYERVFGTKVLMKQTFGEVPWMKGVPDSAKTKLMHIQLPITESTHLMGSDNVEGVSPVKFAAGNNFNVTLVAKDKAEADHAFELLSAGGQVRMAIANAPWGPYFGMCTDRFGVQWMVSLPGPA
jgi:PhnB protein